MFRSLGKSKIAFVLAILFGISLFFFRGGDRYSNLFNSDNVVASVSGTPISTTKFLRVMQMNVNQYSQMFGKRLSSEEIQAFQIHSMALSQLINNAVFENEFDKKKFIIDETVVATETKNRFPNLYTEKNKLNEAALNAFLSQQNLKIDDLVKIIDYEARSNIFDKLFFNVNYPKKMEIVLNKHNNHSRNIDYLKLNINDFQLPNFKELDVSINNKSILNFFENNINSYLDPEKRNISYIIIDKENYRNEFTPSSNEIENYYNNNKNLFLDGEKRDFIQFNFKKLEDATKFKNDVLQLNKDEIIKFANLNNIVFNEFKQVSKNEVLEDLSKAIFSLQKNQLSDVVETTLANHIVLVNNIYTENQKTLIQSKDEIRETLLQVELESYMVDLKNNISQQILDGLSLNEIAQNNSLILENIKNAEKQNNQNQNDLIKNKVILKGFESNKDFVSDIVDIDENKSIIINVDNIEDEKPYELSDIFDLVSNDWIKSLKIENIKNKVKEITQSSNSLQEIANYLDSKITNDDLKFDNRDFPNNFKNSIFSDEINKISISTFNDDIYVSELKSINFSNDDLNPQTISMLSELRGNFGAEIIKNKSISTNDSLIQALVSQY